MTAELTAEEYKEILNYVYKELGNIPASAPGTLSALTELRSKISLALNPTSWFYAPCGHKMREPGKNKMSRTECLFCGTTYLLENKNDTVEVTQIVG